MSSSLTTPTPAPTTRETGLLSLLRSIPDPRHRRGVRHELAVLLAVGLAAVLAGSRSFTAIGEWSLALPPTALDRLGVRGRAPSESTIRRAFARVDAEVLDRLLGVWMWTRTTVMDGRRVIAIDGKTVRGAKSKTRAAPHLLAALDHANGTVVAQLAVAAKSNEIPAARTLLAMFDLLNAVVTLDAMHTQHDTARAITEAGGDYVLTVKANQPRLRAACKRLPWTEVPAYSNVQTGHGRRARRTIRVLACPDWVDFPGATQLAQLRRTTTTKGKTTVEVVYLVTSADHVTAPPATLAGWVQAHWGIENRLHC